MKVWKFMMRVSWIFEFFYLNHSLVQKTYINTFLNKPIQWMICGHFMNKNTTMNNIGNRKLYSVLQRFSSYICSLLSSYDFSNSMICNQFVSPFISFTIPPSNALCSKAWFYPFQQMHIASSKCMQADKSFQKIRHIFQTCL
jgi:hypothetical protein